jgi:hypothetical protein
MSMNREERALDRWRLVWGQPYIDSQSLAAAMEQDLTRDTDPDFQTRLLVRDTAVESAEEGSRAREDKKATAPRQGRTKWSGPKKR